MVESSTLLLGSAPMAVLLQPIKHPPAIQNETLNTSVKRKAFIERNEIIFAQSLLLSHNFVEKQGLAADLAA